MTIIEFSAPLLFGFSAIAAVMVLYNAMHRAFAAHGELTQALQECDRQCAMHYHNVNNTAAFPMRRRTGAPVTKAPAGAMAVRRSRPVLGRPALRVAA